MNKEMIKGLVAISNALDKRGAIKEADYLDTIIKKVATDRELTELADKLNKLEPHKEAYSLPDMLKTSERASRDELKRDAWNGLDKLRNRVTDPIFALAMMEFIQHRLSLDGMAIGIEVEDKEMHSLWKTLHLLAGNTAAHAQYLVDHVQRKIDAGDEWRRKRDLEEEKISEDDYNR